MDKHSYTSDKSHTHSNGSHTHSNGSHTHSNGSHPSAGSRGYKANRREERTKKEAVTPDRKQDYETRRMNGGGISRSLSGGKLMTTPTISNQHLTSNAPTSTMTGNHDDVQTANGSSSRYHSWDVPPRFQLNGNKHNNNRGSSRSPHGKSTQGNNNNKKTRDSSNNHWSPNTGPSDSAWTHTPDTDRNHQPTGPAHSPWSNVVSQTHWGSSSGGGGDYTNSDPLGENTSNSSDPDKFSTDKYGSDSDDVDVDKASAYSDPMGGGDQGVRLRNSDSDAVKDGVSSGTHVQDDPLDGVPMNEGSLWRGHISRSSMGSSSSVNSAGSNSSWKGSNNGNRSNGNGFQRAASPRKHGRYDNHRSMSVTSGKGLPKFPPAKPKKAMDLDDTMDSLQNEPNGWGELPSPKPTNVDTGTEVWGIPDDIKKKMKIGAQARGWSDNTSEWEGNSNPNWGDSNYNKGSGNISSPGPGSHWGGVADQSWKNVMKGNNRDTGFNDNVKLLNDIGFTINESEDALKRNGNIFEVALGELLTIVSMKTDDDLSPSSHVLPGPIPRGLHPARNPSNRLSPSSSGGPSPRTTSPSFNKDQPYPLHVTTAGGSTPATPVSATQNHLMPMYQQSSHPPGGKLARSISLPQSDFSSINTQHAQKVLIEQLREHQMLKQQFVNQMKNPQSPKHQQVLTIRLNQVNASILLVNQQLNMTNRLAMQQQQKGVGPGEMKGPVGNIDLGTPTSSLPSPDVFISDNHSSGGVGNLAFSMHEISMGRSDSTGSSVCQTPTRSVSKLQRIISGENQDLSKLNDPLSDDGNHSVFDDEQYPCTNTGTTLPTPIGQSVSSFNAISKNDPFDNTTVNDFTNKSVATSVFTSSHSQSTSSLTNSGKFSRSVNEIPEFKPGVLWNPSPSSVNPSPFPNNQRRQSNSHAPEPNQRPDSIPLSTGNNSYSNNDPSNFIRSDMDYYNSDSAHYGPSHSSQLVRRVSPNMGGQSNQRYSSNPNFGGGGYYNRQQSGQGYPPRPSPSTPASSQMFPPGQFNPSGAGRINRQRLYSQQSTGGVAGGGGYGDQRNKGYDMGRKWSYDGSNPWGVPEKTGTASIWSVDSAESLLSPSIGSEMAFSPAANTVEWKPPVRKPSLPVNLTAPTHCLILKNIPHNVDESLIHEICSKYGYVQNCSMNTFNASALVYYRSKEEAFQAKSGLEKNHIICDANIQPLFATEKTVMTFSSQHTPSHSYYNHNPPVEPSSPWLGPNHLPSPQHPPRNPASIGSSRSSFSSVSSRSEHMGNKEGGSPWGQEFSAPGGPVLTGTSSSVWSNNGILPGISTPWGTQSNSLAGAERDDPTSLVGTSPSISTFLPNDLF